MSTDMTVKEARTRGVCRICGEPIPTVPGPKNWQLDFGERVYPPPALTLHFGEEFAHTECLKKTENADASSAEAPDAPTEVKRGDHEESNSGPQAD